VFIAVTPMGSTGDGMCFWELYAAQAQAILRLGANDQKQTPDKQQIVICNLAPCGGRFLKVTRQTIFPASKVMVESLRKNFASESVVVLPVHHVEDFHAYNFSECLPDQGSRSAHY
jgi:hypothetical protein